MYWDVKNLYGWATSQKLPEDGFESRKDMFRFDKEFIQNYDEDNKKRYILENNFKYPKKLQELSCDLPFLPKRMKIEKCIKLECNL